jgi:hypothetical protein
MFQAKSSKYSVGQRVLLNDGRTGKIVGVNPIDGTYQVMTADNRSIRLKSKDIDKLSSTKGSGYQESGVDKEDPNVLAIKDTPFDLKNDK